MSQAPTFDRDQRTNMTSEDRPTETTDVESLASSVERSFSFVKPYSVEDASFPEDNAVASPLTRDSVFAVQESVASPARSSPWPSSAPVRVATNSTHTPLPRGAFVFNTQGGLTNDHFDLVDFDSFKFISAERLLEADREMGRENSQRPRRGQPMGPPIELPENEIATQQPPSTIPHSPPSAIPSQLDPEEELDIICFLRPVTQPAFDVVEKAAELSPQHVFRHQGFTPKHREVCQTYDKIESVPGQDAFVDYSQATPEIKAPTETLERTGELALRMSSKVRAIDMGFVFGRDARKSDIVIQPSSGAGARVSGMHFRIFLNDNGIVMLEDMSTNGTIVDNQLLKYKKPVQGQSVRRILTNTSLVELFVDDSRKTARFMVDFPPRRDESAWKSRLQAYVDEIKRARSLRANALRDLTLVPANNGLGGVETTGSNGSDDQHGDMSLVTAATMPFNHGMKWNGDSKYKPVGKIGSGAFATVYKLINVTDGTEIAAKEIEKRRFVKNGVMDMKITTELDILKRSKHPHIISSFNHIDTDHHLYILMEYVPHGDLSQHIGTMQRLGDQECRYVVKQMCQALAYLHDNGIAHRDIKPENILKMSVSPLWIKLADFGLSKVISQGDSTVYQTFCGTLLYCAPEVYPGYSARRRGESVDPKRSKVDPYSVAVDIWSLAAVMFHLVCGVPPYEASAANHGVHMLDAILSTRFPRAKYEIARVAPDWEHFFLNTLTSSARERWSARELLKLDFMRQIPDVRKIDYQYQEPENKFAFEDASSDEEHLDNMAEDLESIVSNNVNDGHIDNDLDASQLSISDAHGDDDIESSMVGIESTGSSEAGLGIHGLDQEAESQLHSEDTSRYNLRARNGPPRWQPAPSARKRRGSPAKPEPLTPAVPQQAGLLFGEIAESGVFGAAANTPRIVNAPQAQSIHSQVRPQFPADISSQADEIAAGNVSPSARRTYLRSAESAASLKSAVGQIGRMRFGTPEDESDGTFSHNGSPSGSERSKHPRAEEEISDHHSTKRSRMMSPSSRKSSSNLINELQPNEASGRPQTPETPEHSSPANDETPRARRPNSHSLAISTEHPTNSSKDRASGYPTLPDTAVAQTFPNTSAPTPAITGQHSSQPALNDALVMPPPPRRSSNTSSRPPTPVRRPSPENPLIPALGVLTPGRNSIAVDPIYITLHDTSWGRHPQCSHVHKDPLDSRIPKTAFTIRLWDPKAGRKASADPNTDWSKTNFYAVISARCSGAIRINGVPMTRKRTPEDPFQFGLLYTGDVIDIFSNAKGEHLHFHVHFWFGASKQERSDKSGESFRVIVGETALAREVAEREAKRSDRTITPG